MSGSCKKQEPYVVRLLLELGTEPGPAPASQHDTHIRNTQQVAQHSVAQDHASTQWLPQYFHIIAEIAAHTDFGALVLYPQGEQMCRNDVEQFATVLTQELSPFLSPIFCDP